MKTPKIGIYEDSLLEGLLAGIIRQRLWVLLGFGLGIAGGVAAFLQTPIDAFPDLSNNQVQILTEAPGLAPLETEQLVTIPLESLMNGLPRVWQLRSISKFGLSVVTVVFEDGVDTYFARQLVNERVLSARSRLPANITPELGPPTTAMGEIYQYVLQGNGYSPTELKTLQDWDIRYRLRSVPGVSEVNTWGGLTQEYVVNLDPQRLLQAGVTTTAVLDALQANNANFSGGLIEYGAQQYVVRGLGRVNTLADIGAIAVDRPGALPIPLRQLGTVNLGSALRQGAVTQDGHGEVVTGMVMMRKGENSRSVIQRVKDQIRAIRASLPEGVRLRPYYDQTRLVEQTLHTVQANLLEGGALVIAVLLLLLGNLRAALIVAVTIPLSLMASFMGMKALGITANLMSLGALDFGMLVDGAIVMMENLLRRLAHSPATTEPATNPLENALARRAVIEAAVAEMARPILFGVLIIAVVYLPILTLEGMEFKLFSPMVLTVIFALLGSLLVALFLVPVLASLFMRGPVQERESWLIRHVRKPYHRLLNQALAHPGLTLITAVVAFVLAVASIPWLGTEFVPKLDEGDLIVTSTGLPGKSLTESVRTATQVEQVLRRFPEVRTVVSKTGRPDLATDPMSPNISDSYVMLHPKSEWPAGHTKADLLAGLHQALDESVLGVNFNFTQPIEMRVNELVSGVRADVAIRLYGEDLTVLRTQADRIEQVMRTVRGQSDLQTERLAGSGQILITPDREKLMRYGVSVNQLRTLIETALLGTPVSEVLDGRKRFVLRVRLASSGRLTPADVKSLLIETGSGSRIPLRQVATVSVGEGLETINRETGRRRVLIQMNVEGRDVGSFVAEGQRRLARRIHLPPGYAIEWGGQFENQQRATRKLMVVVPLSIALIFGLLMVTFANWRQALLVLLNVPFALIGGVLALWVRGFYLSVPALVGFIALFGVAILNGLVLVSTMNALRARGHGLSEAIRQGTDERLRPVLMTALVAMLGFLPMALSTGAGAEVQKPLATVVIGGLFSSTLLTLVVLPVVYRWIETRQLKMSEPL